ncbi:MAG TPA: NACHT domain-containing protein, partial [Thermoanaerobaculia bacterium]|nr:NACHT domain-containing protein [Thermoanaerobaculia bacterium]
MRIFKEGSLVIKRSSASAGITLLLLLLSFCALASTPPSRQTVIEEIRQYAKRHASSGSRMETGLVVDLYRDNAVGLTPQQIAHFYEEEFVKAKAASKEGAWDQFRPKAGWIAAVVLAILLVFRDLLKSWFSAALKWIGEAFYQRLAGHRLLRFIALRRYREALIEKYREIRIPFRPNRPLQMKDVYVPLKLAGDSGIGEGIRIDAYQALSQNRRLMIKGPPGSGKSMLLRHISLAYAEGRLQELADRPIPVLLDLHRLNEDESLGLESHLALEFARNGFPHAETFVRRNLENGTLMLLLDGFDEVASDRRSTVATEIVDFLRKYKRCRFLSTCRTAIYREEFSSVVEQTLEVDEFTDQQIRHFLGSWESSMPPGKSVEQLIYTLSDRPRIMALARNPLLLTIIAYLYSDTTFQLPHSRSEFYESSTDVLLNQWHHEHNSFKARDKRLVLQHLALLFQDSIG